MKLPFLGCRRQSNCIFVAVILTTALVAAAFPVANGFLVYPAFEEILTEGVERDATLITRHISPLLVSEDAEHGFATLGLRELRAIESLERDLKLIKIRFINERGVILYSTDGTEFGGSYDPGDLERLRTSREPQSELTIVDCLYPAAADCVATVVITAVPVLYDGRFIGVLETSMDVTEREDRMETIVFWSLLTMSILAGAFVLAVAVLLRKQAEHVRLLETTQKLRGDVERIVQHDLRSPLSSMLSGVNYLQSEVDDSDQLDLLEQMQTSGWRMMRMINSSLDLYKMESGSYDFVPEAVNMLTVMREVAVELEALAQTLDVGVLLTHEGEPFSQEDRHVVPAESMLCHTLLANLLKNALEEVPEGGEVRMDLRSENDEHVLSVHNPGNVPESIRPVFFDKYVTHGKRTGTGLGTYSARLITETQGGRIRLLCDGSTVTIEVRFPVEPQLSALQR